MLRKAKFYYNQIHNLITIHIKKYHLWHPHHKQVLLNKNLIFTFLYFEEFDTDGDILFIKKMLDRYQKFNKHNRNNRTLFLIVAYATLIFLLQIVE